MKMAIRKAGIRPDEIDYINAHGTSTPLQRSPRDDGDQEVLRRSRLQNGDLVHEVDDGSSAGRGRGLEAGISALAVYNQVAPPTINLDNPDPDCDLDYVPHTRARDADPYALSNSFGFGGTNATLLFKRFEQ